MKRIVYLIDGVSVPRRVFFRRQAFGEYAGARYEIVRPRGD